MLSFKFITYNMLQDAMQVKTGPSMLHDNVHDSTGGWGVKGVSVM